MKTTLWIILGGILAALGLSWLVIVSIAWSQGHTIFKKRRKYNDKF